MKDFIQFGLVAISVLVGTLASASAKPSASSVQSNSEMMAMPLVAPLFIENQNFTSTLVVVNASGVSTYADVVLRDLAGAEIARRRLSLGPYGQGRLDVHSVLTSVGSSATTGSIIVTQSPDLQGMAVAAQLSMSFVKYPQTSYIDEELAMPSHDGSQLLRSVTNDIDGSPWIAITSLSASTQQIKVECLISPHFSKSVQLAPGETLITEACTDVTEHLTDFQTLLERAQGGPRRAMGIALSTDAAPGSFAAFGLGLDRREDQQFWSTVSFADPMTIKSSTSVFPGVPVGAASALPEGKYVPQLALSNFSNFPANVRILYATTDAAGGVREIKRVFVPSSTSMLIKLNDIAGDPGLRNSFIVTSDQDPGGVIASLVSTSQSRLPEVELPAKDEKDPENGGNHPWNLEQGTESTLLLFNHSSKFQLFNVLVSSGKNVWQKTYKLKSMQTEAISIRTLIESGLLDDSGKRLPEGSLSGVARWFVPEPGYGKGRLMQSNRDLAMARSFSCAAFYVLCGASINPTSVTLNVPDSRTFSGTPHYCVGYNSTSCSGPTSGTGTSVIHSWSGDTNILTFTCSGTTACNATARASGTGKMTYHAQSFTGCAFFADCAVTIKPKITNTSPTIAMIGGNSLQITINGSGFGASPTVNLPSGFTKTQQTSSDTQIVVTVNIANTSIIGVNQITVTAGGQNSNSVNFTVDGDLIPSFGRKLSMISDEGKGNRHDGEQA